MDKVEKYLSENDMVKAEEKRAKLIVFLTQSIQSHLDVIRQHMTGSNPDFNRSGQKYTKEIKPMFDKLGKAIKSDPRRRL